MYLSQKYKVAFIHIPKTGGAAVVNAMHGARLGIRRVGGLSRHRGFLPGFTDKDWFVFTFVRNPYHRLVSMYRHRRLIGKPPESLRLYLNWIKKDAVTVGRPMVQVDFIAPGVEVFRYENFDADLKAVFGRIGVQVPQVFKDQSSHFYGDYDWRDFVDEDSLAVINRRFRRDFERFGYEKLTWKQLQA